MLRRDKKQPYDLVCIKQALEEKAFGHLDIAVLREYCKTCGLKLPNKGGNVQTLKARLAKHLDALARVSSNPSQAQHNGKRLSTSEAIGGKRRKTDVGDDDKKSKEAVLTLALKYRELANRNRWLEAKDNVWALTHTVESVMQVLGCDFDFLEEVFNEACCGLRDIASTCVKFAISDQLKGLAAVELPVAAAASCTALMPGSWPEGSSNFLLRVPGLVDALIRLTSVSMISARGFAVLQARRAAAELLDTVLEFANPMPRLLVEKELLRKHRKAMQNLVSVLLGKRPDPRLHEAMLELLWRGLRRAPRGTALQAFADAHPALSQLEDRFKGLTAQIQNLTADECLNHGREFALGWSEDGEPPALACTWTTTGGKTIQVMAVFTEHSICLQYDEDAEIEIPWECIESHDFQLSLSGGTYYRFDVNREMLRTLKGLRAKAETPTSFELVFDVPYWQLQCHVRERGTTSMTEAQQDEERLAAEAKAKKERAHDQECLATEAEAEEECLLAPQETDEEDEEQAASEAEVEEGCSAVQADEEKLPADALAAEETDEEDEEQAATEAEEEEEGLAVQAEEEEQLRAEAKAKEEKLAFERGFWERLMASNTSVPCANQLTSACLSNAASSWEGGAGQTPEPEHAIEHSLPATRELRVQVAVTPEKVPEPEPTLEAQAEKEEIEILEDEWMEVSDAESAKDGEAAADREAEDEVAQKLDYETAEDGEAAEDHEAEEEAAQMLTLMEKNLADIAAAMHKAEEKARGKRQQMASKVVKMKLPRRGQSIDLEAARSMASKQDEIVKAAPTTNFQVVSLKPANERQLTDVRNHLGNEAVEKIKDDGEVIHAALLKRGFSEAVRLVYVSSPSKTGMPGDGTGESLQSVLCGIYFEMPSKFNDKPYYQKVQLRCSSQPHLTCYQQYIQWSEPRKYWKIGMLDDRCAGHAICREAAMHPEELVFQSRDVAVEQIAEVRKKLRHRVLATGIKASVDNLLMKQQSKSAEIRREGQAYQDAVRHALAEKQESVKNAASEVIQETLAQARAKAEEIAAAHSSKVAVVEEENLLLERLATVERRTPEILEARRADCFELASAAEEQSAEAKQVVIDQHNRKSQSAESLQDSQTRLAVIESSLSDSSASAKAAWDKAEANETAASEAEQRTARNAEHQIEERKAQKQQAEQQGKIQVDEAQQELVHAEGYLADAKKSTAEACELQRFAHQKEMEAISQKDAAQKDAMTREWLALRDMELTAAANAEDAQLQAQRSMEVAEREAEQEEEAAEAQFAKAKQQADDAWEQRRREIEHKVSVAQDAAAAAKSKADDNIKELQKGIDQTIQPHQSKLENQELLLQRSENDLSKAEEMSGEVARATAKAHHHAQAKAAKAIETPQLRVRLAKASFADAVEKVSKERYEAQKTSEATCEDFAAKREAARLSKEQHTAELDDKAAKKEQHAVQEFAEISARLKTAMDEAKSEKDEFAAETEAARMMLHKQEQAAEEEIRVTESDGQKLIDKAIEDLDTQDKDLRLLKLSLQSHQLMLEEKVRLVKESDQRVVVATSQREDASLTEKKALLECSQSIADDRKIMEKTIQEARAEKEAQVSKKEKEALSMKEESTLAEAAAQAQTEAAAKAKQSDDKQVECARKANDDMLCTFKGELRQKQRDIRWIHSGTNVYKDLLT